METHDEQEGKTVSVPDYIKILIGNPTQLLECIVSNEGNEIQSIAWELLGLIVDHLKEQQISNAEDLQTYEDCFVRITEVCSPKDLYLGVLEHFDPNTQARYAELLIPALSAIIHRLLIENDDACATVLEITYSTLDYYLDSLNLPSYETFEPDSTTEESHEAIQMVRFIQKIISLFEPVISALKMALQGTEKFSQYQAHTFRFMCNCLVKLGQIHLSSQSSLYLCENIMELTSMFYSPTFLFSSTNWKCTQPEEERSEESAIEVAKQVERGRACYLHLLFCKGFSYNNFPLIYSVDYIVSSIAVPLQSLLSCKNHCVMWKGLELFSFTLDKACKLSFSIEKLNTTVFEIYTMKQLKIFESSDPVKTIFNLVINDSIFPPSVAVRRKAAKLLITFLDKFNWGDRFLILLHLLKSVEHSGVIGLLIGYWKEKLFEVLIDSQQNGLERFCEKKRTSILVDLIFNLPDGIETDLLAESDRIMASLNCLKFIQSFDKTDKLDFSLRSHIEKVKQKYLEVLRSAIDLSRAHYRNELNKYQKKPKTNPDSSKEPEFTVNGMPLTGLPYKDQKNTLQCALNTFDLMENLM